jgi:hypothetical protein
MNCLLRSYDYKEYRRQGGKFSLVGFGIGLRSKLTHSELQFSRRYHRVSVSATCQDGCKCVRFKKIGYSNSWWVTKVIPANDYEEDEMFKRALKDAGVSRAQFNAWISNWSFTCLWGKKAKKYDLAGVSFSFILPKWRVWRPSKKWVWCSEECKEIIGSAKHHYRSLWGTNPPKLADETTPQDLDREVGWYIGFPQPACNPALKGLSDETDIR